MKKSPASSPPDIDDSWPAMQRAAKRAWALSKATGTPFYVVKNGRIVNLNPGGRLTPKRKVKR